MTDESRRREPADKGINQLPHEPGPNIFGDPKRDVAHSRYLVGAKPAIKHGEDRCKIAPRALNVSRMMPLVHSRRHKDPAQRSVCPRHIGMNEFSIVVSNDLVRNERPGRKAQ